MAREQLKNLTEPMYYILLSLLKENHGYGIMQMVDELTEGRVAIGAGTLYSLLGRFEKEEIIVQVAEENRRKIYKITEKGAELLREEYERLNHLVEDGKKFFNFDGERKEPPAGGGGQKEELESCAGKAAVSQQAKQQKQEKQEKQEKKERQGREKKERGGIPRRGFNYGGVV